MLAKGFSKPTDRVERLRSMIVDAVPCIEAERAVLITESYQATEGLPMIMRRAKALENILNNLTVTIRDDELVVGTLTKAVRSCQLFPENSYKWVMDEFDTIETRMADPFKISEEDKATLRKVLPYWEDKTISDLASSYMSEKTKECIANGVFTVGNYFFGGVGHIIIDYDKAIRRGYKAIIQDAVEALESFDCNDPDFIQKTQFCKAIITVLSAAINFAKRYSDKAKEMAAVETNPTRKAELLQIAANCEKVPANGATNFYEACQSFIITQMILQVESSGHSESPGRFDQYMYPYYKKDLDSGKITREFAQELLDCIWVKLNDLNKCRDAASAEGFAGYSLFQNLIVGGQNEEGIDVTNDLSFMCITSSMHVFLPMPSLSVRVWNGSPHEFLIYAAELTRTGIGLPAYYNDEVIIPSLESRGLTLQDARDYNIIGCVEPQKSGKTNGWHDAAFFNMCRPLELVFSNGVDKGVQIGPKTGNVEDMKTFDEFYDAYKAQMDYAIALLVNADNAIDMAHAERAPLPFLASMVDDCIKRGKTLEQGGAVYNFTGPQGFGVANMADALYAVKKLVYDENKITMHDLKMALSTNYGKGLRSDDVAEMVSEVASAMKSAGQPVGEKEVATILKTVVAATESEQVKANGERILKLIDAVPKFGNDIPEVDAFARDVAYTYTKPLEKYKNPRGGMFQAGLYPVSANVPLGGQTGATPDGRLAHMPVADGVSPSAGKDVNGPTAAANSVSRLDHFIASNGTLFNQKFHPSALSGREGLEKFVGLIQSYFDQKGSHMQFNVVSRETLLDAQKHPEQYKHLVVRVAGYSALFTTLSKSLQDDIIRRTEQGF